MPLDPFPERIDAVKLFVREGSITAALPFTRLQRFTGQLFSDGVGQTGNSGKTGQVAVDLLFGRDEEGRRLLTGTLETRVEVICQRCLQAMPLALQSTLSLLVVDTEEELQELPASRDAVTMPESGLDVVALIEDELILSLPMVPMHADTACNQVLNGLVQGREPAVAVRANPFAVLAGLKSQSAKKPAKVGRKRAKTGKPE